MQAIVRLCLKDFIFYNLRVGFERFPSSPLRQACFGSSSTASLHSSWIWTWKTGTYSLLFLFRVRIIPIPTAFPIWTTSQKFIWFGPTFPKSVPGHTWFLYRTGSPYLTFLGPPLMPCYHFWDLNAMFSPHIFAFHLQSSMKDSTFWRFPTSGSEIVLLRQVFSTRGSDTFVSMMSLMAFMYGLHITLIWISGSCQIFLVAVRLFSLWGQITLTRGLAVLRIGVRWHFRWVSGLQ